MIARAFVFTHGDAVTDLVILSVFTVCAVGYIAAFVTS